MNQIQIDKTLSLRMAILKLTDGQQNIAKAAEIDGSINNIGFHLRGTGYTPYDVAQYANEQRELSDEALQVLMDACNCRLYCEKVK
jgi:hypothetical protein